MIPALHPATASLPEAEAYVHLAARNGFTGIDHSAAYWARWVQTTSLAYVQEFCGEQGCAIVHGSLPMNLRADDATFAEDLKELPRFAAIMSDLGVRAMCKSVPCATPLPAAEAYAKLVARLKSVRGVLTDFGLSFGIEFVGPKTSRGQDAPLVCDLPGAIDLCGDVGPGCGLLIDSYHWYTSHATVEDIMMLDPAMVLHIHLNDAMAGPVDELLDRKRLLPGAGVIDLRGFLGALARLGYDGAVSVETFSDSLDAAGPEEAARLAGETMGRTLSAFV